ncbi:MAG: polysaccharide deacetylase family protein [Actinomycetia bacterium]|nr:polysaccharide deacetylase family protein [Actinomycetes bacterium]
MSNPRVSYAIGTQRAPLQAPEPGKNIIVSISLNVEHWPLDRPMPRKIISPPHGRDHVPDVPNFSWAEYGMRLGLPRLVELISRYGLAISVNLNAGVISAYPQAAEMLLDTGWEFVGHGVDQQALTDAPDERAVIRQALDDLTSFSGRPVRGWLGPGLQETIHTPDVLAECGVDYLCDWVLDDVPVWLRATPKPLVAVPYSLDLNDSVIYAVERQSSPELYRRVVDTLRSYDEEGAGHPMVLSLPIHPHLVGVRHRLPYFRDTLNLLQQREDTVFLTGSEICDWFLAQQDGS